MTAIKERKSKKTVRASNSDENFLFMYLNEIGRIPLLSREDEEKAAREAAAGSKTARDRLVNANLRFVVNVAKKYQGQGVPLADLISEGNIGLLDAVDRFDPERGYRFISYAVWWVRQSILRALNEKSRMIRLPQHRAVELLEIEKAKKLIQEHHTAENEIREIAELLDMNAAEVRELLNISRETISLESPVSVENHDSLLGDFIVDDRYASPDQAAMRSVLKDELEDMLETLDQREADIIRYRYGLGHYPMMSLKEIGDHLHLTKERIRQLENKAIARLQRRSQVRKMKIYVA